VAKALDHFDSHRSAETLRHQKLGGLHARKRAFSRRMCFPDAEWYLIPAAVLLAGEAEEGVDAFAGESPTLAAL
jgi:hypothetical protein